MLVRSNLCGTSLQRGACGQHQSAGRRLWLPHADRFPSGLGGNVGDFELLRTAKRKIELSGPGGKLVKANLNDQWMGLDASLPVPLYVGKTTNIRRRMGQHLMLGSTGKVISSSTRKQRAPTTSCQVRAGVERLFPRKSNPIELLRTCLGLSFVVLDGDEHAANRFYLENLAIGRMRPVFNFDVER